MSEQEIYFEEQEYNKAMEIMSKNVIFMIDIVHNERSKTQGYEYSKKSWKAIGRWLAEICRRFRLLEMLLPK